jgi:hypothetical protein
MEKQDIANSINIIEQAIQEARKLPNGAYFYDILWGTILAIYYLANYFSLSNPDAFISNFNHYYWVLFPIGGIVSAIRSKQDDRNETAKSLADKIYLFAYSGFAFAYITIYLAAAFYGFNAIVIPVFCSLLGLTVFVTGGIVKESLSVIMGLFGMLVGAYMLNMDVSHQYLFASFVSVMVSIVPGIKMMFSRV